MVVTKEQSPEARLKSYVARLDPKIQKLFRSVRTAMRKRFPAAHELAYDYRSSVVIAYSPTDRAIDGLLSIAGRANGVQLYFNWGKKLPDPKKLLKGSAKQVRFIWLESAKQLAHPDVQALLGTAMAQARVPFPSKGKGDLIIKT
jgi:hypothetical protein